MKDSIKRIAVIGPESTGKSELCEKLAVHYKTNWVPEYARAFLMKLDRPYLSDDILEIYETQFLQEQQLLKTANNCIFTDTEFIIAKVWMEHVFSLSIDYFDSMILKYPYDLYLLTSPDLPWEYDPLRENPGKGSYFFNWYKTILEKNNLNFGIVSGTGIHRTQNAIAIVEQNFGEQLNHSK